MTYTEFQTQILSLVSKRAPEGKNITLHTVRKNNGVFFTGIFSNPHEEDFAAPVLYLEDFYEFWKKGETLENIADQIASALFSMPGFTLDTALFKDPAFLRDSVYLRLYGCAQNRENLKNWLYRAFLDMVVSYVIRIDNPVLGSGSIKLTQTMAKEAGMDEAELYDIALANTEERLGESLRTLDEVLNHEPSSREVYYLSNRENLFGASALLYSKELQKMADQKEGNLFILPSSVHEVILLPEKGNSLAFLKQMVQTVNDTEVQDEEVLTNSIYLYDRKMRKIILCT